MVVSFVHSSQTDFPSLVRTIYFLVLHNTIHDTILHNSYFDFLLYTYYVINTILHDSCLIFLLYTYYILLQYFKYYIFQYYIKLHMQQLVLSSTTPHRQGGKWHFGLPLPSLLRHGNNHVHAVAR